MAKIDTDITTGSISSIGTTPSVNVGSGRRIIDSSSQVLAKSLSGVSEALGKYVQIKEKEKATEATVEGANAINGMTLEDARELHKAGFPDIKNEWARYGAYKQYASNSSDNFVFEYQKEYLANQNSKEWNWQTALAEKTATFNAGKENDVYFESAMLNANETIKKWTNAQELVKESKILTERVNKDTSFAITTIPEKIKTKLEVQFMEDYAMPYDYDSGEFEAEKQKYMLENFTKSWDEELQIVKDNLNPAITLSDLDGLIIEAGESHVATDGRFAAFYAKMLTERRADGTPSIAENPRWNEAAAALLAKIAGLEGLDNFESDFNSGKTMNYDNSEYNKNANELLKQKIKIIKANNSNISDTQAIELAIDGMLPALKNNPPVTYIKDILGRTISRGSTPQSRLAFSLALKLHQNGMLGAYFNKDNKMSVFWSIATKKHQAGEDPDKILKEIGQYSNNFKAYTTLVSENKEEFNNDFSDLDMFKPKNKQIIYTMGEYFKNIIGEDGWKEGLINWVDINYEEYGGVLYSKNELQEIGINASDYEFSKKVIAKMLVKKLDMTSHIDSDWETADLNRIVDIMDLPPEEQPVDFEIEDYELIINSQDGELSLGVKAVDYDYQLPATMTTEDNQVFWLTVPKKEFKKKLLEMKLEQNTLAAERARLKSIEIEKAKALAAEQVKLIGKAQP